MNELDQPMRMNFTSDPEHLSDIRSAVERVAEMVGFSEEECGRLALAVNEAVNNIISHGYEGCGGQPIELTIERTVREGRGALQIIICDCGRQVDPDTITGRDLDDVRPGGLGTHIMQAVMDEIEYSPRQPQGMQVRLVKILSS
jgi:anti-sigma regulatory factor (Ser/Thr protein kinase)